MGRTATSSRAPGRDDWRESVGGGAGKAGPATIALRKTGIMLLLLHRRIEMTPRDAGPEKDEIFYLDWP
jgi:hypothetical protein